MPVIARSVVKSRNAWVCDDCEAPIPDGDLYLRLFGSAHRGERPYVIRLCISCGAESPPPKRIVIENARPAIPGSDTQPSEEIIKGLRERLRNQTGMLIVAVRQHGKREEIGRGGSSSPAYTLRLSRLSLKGLSMDTTLDEWTDPGTGDTLLSVKVRAD